MPNGLQKITCGRPFALTAYAICLVIPVIAAGSGSLVMGSGMGMPSMGIYSYELFHFYGVQNIIRIGSAGGISDSVALRDVIAVLGASTDSNYASQYNLPGSFCPTASFPLLERAVTTAQALKIPVQIGNVLSSDFFYGDDEHALLQWKKMGVLAVEMETAALYMNASRCGKSALSLLTVSDCPLRGRSALRTGTGNRLPGHGRARASCRRLYAIQRGLNSWLP